MTIFVLVFTNAPTITDKKDKDIANKYLLSIQINFYYSVTENNEKEITVTVVKF